MVRDHRHNPDPNVNAARIVGESMGTDLTAAGDVGAAWAAWSVDN